MAGSDDHLYSRLVADNCPCHVNCYRGCKNCGTWECPGREWVDPETPIWAQPDGVGNENNIDGTYYELVFSDEFNGDMLNSNKWHLRYFTSRPKTAFLVRYFLVYLNENETVSFNT